MEIVPDPMLVGAFFVPFLVAVAATYAILWRPLAAWMEERDHASHHAQAEANRLDKVGQERVVELEGRLNVIRSELTAMRAASRAQAAQTEKDVVSAARAEAEARIAQASTQIAEQAEVARRGLRDAAVHIAGDMAGQVLGRPVQG
jgi:F0F1-type ATP synthase membrane subunit b/b'